MKIALNDATNPQLLHFAGVVLGIDGINRGQNNKTLIGKILAVDPTITEIEVPDDLTTPTPVEQVAPPQGIVPAQKVAPRKRSNHYRDDPKVTLSIAQGSGTGVKDVQLDVNGDVVTVRRGATVDVPYRHYLALLEAKTARMVETGETNPQTGMPILEPVDEPTYPFSVVRMPSDEEIADFHARTDDQAQYAEAA